MNIGPYRLANPVVLAPMSGVTDQPFRQLCRRLGAGLTVSEMVSANALRHDNRKTRQRLLPEDSGSAPFSVQILGAEPAALAEAARRAVDAGATLVDINMGCPAKKVCRVDAGSALLKDEALIARILQAVVAAVPVPVTLKTRTGWDPGHRNGVAVARLAEACGIQALAMHGRTRACGYSGQAEYDTIAQAKAAVRIPVIANGDIRTPEQARQVLQHTGADGVMIGRAALGRPWLLGSMARHLAGEAVPEAPTPREIHDLILEHLDLLYGFYGAEPGARVARKHLAWYAKDLRHAASFRRHINDSTTPEQQRKLIEDFFIPRDA